MDRNEPSWLPAPLTTLFSDRDGWTRAAYVQLRTGRTVRVEQPDRDYPVFLYIGADDLPVGIKFTARISFEIRRRIRFVLSADGVGREVTHSFRPIPAALVEPTLRQLEQASTVLGSAAAGPRDDENDPESLQVP
jgi:hypothetical protein